MTGQMIEGSLKDRVVKLKEPIETHNLEVAQEQRRMSVAPAIPTVPQIESQPCTSIDTPMLEVEPIPDLPVESPKERVLKEPLEHRSSHCVLNTCRSMFGGAN